MKRVLILANAFPWGSWEPYLATELSYIPRKYEVSIFSLMLREEQRTIRRKIPVLETNLHPIPFGTGASYIIWSLKTLIEPDFYREIKNLLTQKRLNLNTLKALAIFLSRVNREAHIIKKILKNNPQYKETDKVIIYAYRYNYQPYLAKKISRYFVVKPKIIARCHGKDIFEEENPGNYLPLRKQTAESCDQIWSVSDHGAEYLKRYPETEGKVQVQRLGIENPNRFQIKKDEEKLRIGTISTLTPVKQLDKLIPALALLPKDLPVIWHHFGTGPLENEIKQSVTKLPKNIEVVFHGQVSNSEIQTVLQNRLFDFLLNLSRSEGVPVSIMEALAHGIPVLATAIKGNMEIVKDNKNGFLISPDFTSKDLAQVLNRIANLNLSETEKYSKAARESGIQEWNSQINYSQTWQFN